ncbi:phospho-N-acetylmuramoyl-pentapeptide-transferase [Elusimicrobiota bacterium]
MLYHIFYPLSELFSPFNVFQYISFRAAGAVLTSLILSFIIGPILIKYLRKIKAEQIVRSDGPQTHITKIGTPTMGGLLIFLSLFISTILWARLDNRFIILLLIGTVILGFLGFFDDYLKLIKKHSNGVSPVMKLLVQGVLAFGVAIYLFYFPPNAEFATAVNIPYLKNVFINLYAGYVLFAVIVIVGSSNAVNLTDGLDGLAIGNLLIAAATLSLFAYFAGHVKIAGYLRIVHVIGAGEIAIFLAAMIGSGLGFLWFNSYPAEIFMGDTGSLFLGGTLGLVAVFIKQEILLAVVCGVFVMEALSVIIQVYTFKRTGKRVFKMAPLHHHFELSGWSETKVTIRFWIIGIILALIAFAALKVR